MTSGQAASSTSLASSARVSALIPGSLWRAGSTAAGRRVTSLAFHGPVRTMSGLGVGGLAVNTRSSKAKVPPRLASNWVMVRVERQRLKRQ